MNSDLFNFKNLSIFIVIMTILAVVVAAFNQNKSNNLEHFDTKYLVNSVLDDELIEIQDKEYNIQGLEKDIVLDNLEDYYSIYDFTQSGICSKSCCTLPPRWPQPFRLEDDVLVKNNLDKFSQSNMFCSDSENGSGCLCLTKDQKDFLSKRGNNA